MGEEEKKKRVALESLGWLTESSIMPKKLKAIEGVGASSILELKAELYKSQEESKKSTELSGSDVAYHHAKLKIIPNDAFSPQNSGVDTRANQDKLALKAMNDAFASYVALEKKAELYEKLVKGELSDEEDKKKNCVDLFRMSSIEDQQTNNFSAVKEPESLDDEEDAFIPFNSEPMGLGRAAGSMDIDEHKGFIGEVHEEVNQAREKVSELKLRRQEQAAARREKLKQTTYENNSRNSRLQQQLNKSQLYQAFMKFPIVDISVKFLEQYIPLPFITLLPIYSRIGWKKIDVLARA